jgi:hypothetical protein
MSMTTFKVVARRNGVFVPPSYKAPIIYEIGKTTIPPEGYGPLSAFWGRHIAIHYLLASMREWAVRGLYSGDYAILACQAEPWDAPLKTFNGEMYGSWDKQNLGCRLSDMPAGVVLCKALTPIRALTIEEIEEHYIPTVYTAETGDGGPVIYPAIGIKGFGGMAVVRMIETWAMRDAVPQTSRVWSVLEAAGRMARAATLALKEE